MKTTWAEPKEPGVPREAIAAAGDHCVPRSPRAFTDLGPGVWAAALAVAESDEEPIFVPLTPHVDERGWSLMNLFVGAIGGAGQVNFSVQHPGVVKAWHRHERQTDFWCCVGGTLKAGVHRESDGQSWLHVFGEHRPGVLIIPPLLWHGAVTVGATSASLLYYVTRAYDAAAPDEQRLAFDGVPGFPWEPRNG